MTKEQLNIYVTIIATCTLSIIVLSMVCALLVGLFNPLVDNADIFKAITPALQTVVGAFVGLVAGIKMGTDDKQF
jgi:hypothetical protein